MRSMRASKNVSTVSTPKDKCPPIYTRHATTLTKQRESASQLSHLVLSNEAFE